MQPLSDTVEMKSARYNVIVNINIERKPLNVNNFFVKITRKSR